MGNLIEIAGFYDPEETYCAKGLLQSHGIEAIVQNEHHLTMAPWLRVALGGYRLLIISDLAEDARRILDGVGPHPEKGEFRQSHDTDASHEPTRRP